MKITEKTMTNFMTKQDDYIELINKTLYAYVSKTNKSYDIVKEAMLYSIFAGGKRIRPILTIEFALINGGTIEDALPFACAVEMIHCYSLIHDDLPCMDDDKMRRGKPSCHIKYGEANALLAGDALLTLAFETISKTNVEPSVAIKAVRELAVASGMNGMIGGQVMDLENEGKPIDKATIMKISALKTSALVKAACALGSICANADEEAIDYSKEYGGRLGLAFQIVDDILDVYGDEKTVGKPIGSDNENNKATFVTLFGLEESKKIAEKTTDEAIRFLSKLKNNEFLINMTKMLLKREY